LTRPTFRCSRSSTRSVGRPDTGREKRLKLEVIRQVRCRNASTRIRCVAPNPREPGGQRSQVQEQARSASPCIHRNEDGSHAAVLIRTRGRDPRTRWRSSSAFYASGCRSDRRFGGTGLGLAISKRLRRRSTAISRHQRYGGQYFILTVQLDALRKDRTQPVSMVCGRGARTSDTARNYRPVLLAKTCGIKCSCVSCCVR